MKEMSKQKKRPPAVGEKMADLWHTAGSSLYREIPSSKIVTKYAGALKGRKF